MKMMTKFVIMDKLKYWFGNKEPKEDVYITQNTIEHFNNMIIKFYKKQRELQQELQRKDNNWNELKKMLEENKLNIAQALNFYDGKSYNGAIIDILDRIKELENDIK